MCPSYRNVLCFYPRYIPFPLDKNRASVSESINLCISWALFQFTRLPPSFFLRKLIGHRNTSLCGYLNTLSYFYKFLERSPNSPNSVFLLKWLIYGRDALFGSWVLQYWIFFFITSCRCSIVFCWQQGITFHWSGNTILLGTRCKGKGRETKKTIDFSVTPRTDTPRTDIRINTEVSYRRCYVPSLGNLVLC